MDPKRRSRKRTGPGVTQKSWASVMILTKSQPWPHPPKLTPISSLAPGSASLLTSKRSSAHGHHLLDLGSLHAMVLPASPCSQAAGSGAVTVTATFQQLFLPDNRQPGARSAVCFRVDSLKEETLASCFRGRAVCFLPKSQRKDCAVRSLKFVVHVTRTCQCWVTAWREGGSSACGFTARKGRLHLPRMLATEFLSE